MIHMYKIFYVGSWHVTLTFERLLVTWCTDRFNITLYLCDIYITNWLVFITEIKGVYYAVRTGSLNKGSFPFVFKALIIGFKVFMFPILHKTHPIKIWAWFHNLILYKVSGTLVKWRYLLHLRNLRDIYVRVNLCTVAYKMHTGQGPLIPWKSVTYLKTLLGWIQTSLML